MKALLRKLFQPLLAIFEKGEPAQSYRPSHRKILLAVGLLFFVLFAVSLYVAVDSAQLASALPAVIFGLSSLVCLLVGYLGSDVAVARVWGLK